MVGFLIKLNQDKDEISSSFKEKEKIKKHATMRICHHLKNKIKNMQ